MPGDVTGLFSKFEQFHPQTPADGHQKERKYDKILTPCFCLIKIDKYTKNCFLSHFAPAAVSLFDQLIF